MNDASTNYLRLELLNQSTPHATNPHGPEKGSFGFRAGFSLVLVLPPSGEEKDTHSRLLKILPFSILPHWYATACV